MVRAAGIFICSKQKGPPESVPFSPWQRLSQSGVAQRGDVAIDGFAQLEKGAFCVAFSGLVQSEREVSG
jgi:hypothetical protein